MTAQRVTTANAFKTELTAELGPTGLQLTVGTTSGLATDCYLIIEPRSATKREYVWIDSTVDATHFNTTLIANRYLTGSAQVSGITHPIGAEVWCVPTKQLFDDIFDYIEAVEASVAAHLADTTAAHAASAISNAPAGGIAATTVQAALDELDAEKQPLDTDLTAIAGLTSAANKIPRATGAGTWDLIDFKDEDNMASDSATAVPSQQSVKAYVDANSGTTGLTSARARRTTGNLTLNSTTWADVDTGLDLTLADVVDGDVVEVSVSCRWNDESPEGYLDVASIVAGAPVNYWATGGNDAYAGNPGWHGAASAGTGASGVIQKAIVSGDLSAGTLTLRLRYRTSAASNKLLFAGTSYPLIFEAKNLGQP
jgi:hypothetical protein